MIDDNDNNNNNNNKGSRGTHDLLFIDKMILQSARNAYDMLPHSWIKECLDWFGVASNVKNLLFKSMEQWRTELSSMSTPIGEVKINRGIFQGDALSPLLFEISLIPLSLLLRKTKYGFDPMEKR